MLLNGKWNCEVKGDAEHSYKIDGTVPGCVHTDLYAAGVIGDMYWRDNNDAIQWIENCDVVYSRSFTVDEVKPQAYLVFDGLDVYCDIFLNGKKIGQADDMFCEWEFLVDGVLQKGENFLEVCFRSPVKEVEGLPARAAAFTCERLYTRRIQCTYSWDWVARYVTMGIWRDVKLEYHGEDRLLDTYVYTHDINPYSAQVGIKLSFENVTRTRFVNLKIITPDGECVFERERKILDEKLTALVDIKEPQLWYPNGYGEQPLYTLVVTHEQGEIKTKFGIRKVTILEIEDEPDSAEAKKAAEIKKHPHLLEWDRNEGSSCFILLINDVKVFCKGGNWVPSEPFPSAETPEKIDRLIRMAKEANFNMIRVWGGGIFEQQPFYDACDRYGILVTQDFLMACGTYPEEDDYFIEQLKKEAKSAALQLRNHPSLVWWSGDNENAVRGDENSFKYDGRRAAFEGIMPVLEKYDPVRRFLPSSPYGGVPYASGVRGTSHNTNFLGPFYDYARTGDLTDYRRFFETFLVRFTAEQPIMGMPYVSSLLKFMTEEDIFGEDTYMSEYHCKNNPGFSEVSLYGHVELLVKGIFGDYGTDYADRIRKMQMLQCEWLRVSMELFRRNQWFSSGMIYWMFNDCWPAANSWSIVDYYAMPKPAYYAFKRCAAPVISSVTKEEGEYEVYLSNHKLSAVKGKARLYVYNIVSGEEQTIKEFGFTAASNGTEVICSVPEEEVKGLSSETVILCDIIADGQSDRAFFLPFNWDKMPWEKKDAYIIDENETQITITADNAVAFALIDVPYMLEENSFFIKKGEKKTVRKSVI